MPVVTSPNVLRGLAEMDNAGVYRLTDDLAIIETVDFFTPIVDDPYTYGQIAVANSLSDVYTMGGKPITAMNIVCFPSSKMPVSILRDMLKGGADKLVEAGVVLVGGHSVDDLELKFGLSVTGTVHPAKLITNGGARPGDRLILTKPLGTGVITTAVKARMASDETLAKIVESMASLNKTASELMQEVGVNACTDITGFGFAGHACQMAQNSGVGFKIDGKSVPFFPEVVKFIQLGLHPAGLHRNWKFYSPRFESAGDVAPYMRDILFDPQTSGGLLISVPAPRAETLLSKLHSAGVTDSSVIGEVVAGKPGSLRLE